MAAKQTYTVAINAETKGAVRGLNNMNTALKAFISLAAAKQVLDFSKEIVNATSTIETYNNKLRIITNSSKQFADTQSMLVRLAGETRSSYGEVLDLFSKLKVSTEALGISSDRVATVTANLSKALVVAGADGNTAASVIRQFGQAMASGEVRGDEFRSLVEGLGPALSVMARETGITVGELRTMSREGKLTADVMFEMIENSTALSAAFGQMEETIANVETAFGDSKVNFMGFLGEVSGISDLYKEMLKDTMRFMDRMSGREGSLALVKDEDLVPMLSGAQALAEIESRYNNIFELFQKIEAGGFTGDMLTGGKIVSPEQQIAVAKQKPLGMGRVDEVEAIFDLIRLYKELAAEEQAEAEANAARNQAMQETNALIADINKGHTEQIKLLEANKKLNFGTALEKQTEKVKAQHAAIMTLEHQIEELNKLEKDDQDLIQAEIQEKIDLLNKSNEIYMKLLKVQSDLTEAELDKEQKAKDAADEAASSLERQIMLMSEFDEHQQNINAVLEEERKLKEEINAQIFDQITATQLLAQVEANRIHKIEELEEKLRKDQEERDKEKREEDAQTSKDNISNFFEVNKKNFAVLGKYSKMAFELNKALAIAEALMGARQAALNAFAFTMKVFPPLAPVAMAASYAATAATVAGIASQQYAGRAGGGLVNKGQPYIVGEAGKEMFVPSQNGTIVSNSDMKGQAVNVNFNIDATDATAFDELLVTRKNLIVSMVRQAVGQGRL
mgnify:CR=1 FL=1